MFRTTQQPARYLFDCPTVPETTGKIQWKLRDKPSIGFCRIDASSWSIVINGYSAALISLVAQSFPVHYPIQSPLRDLAAAVASHIGCSPKLIRGSETVRFVKDRCHYVYTNVYPIGNTGFIVARPVDVSGGEWLIDTASCRRDTRIDSYIAARVDAQLAGQIWSTRAAAIESLKQAFAHEQQSYRQQPIRYRAAAARVNVREILADAIGGPLSARRTISSM